MNRERLTEGELSDAVGAAADPKLVGGGALLGLSAWVRRQAWLRAVYRHLPVGLRMSVSQALARRAAQKLKFRRTARWRSIDSQALLQLSRAQSSKPAIDGLGVNIFGYLRGQFGLAESARLYARALLHSAFPVALYDIPLDLAHHMGDASMSAYVGTDTPYGVNIVFVNPDYLDAASAAIGSEKLDGRYTIGCWFWELENFPSEWLPALDHVDEIMVSSEFVRDLLRRVTDKPILHVPLPVLDVPDSGLTRGDFGLGDDDYVFLASFDFNSFMDRKNPLAAIQAFRLAFVGGNERVRLIIKSSNGHRHPDRLRQLLGAAEGDPRILVRDEVLEREHVQALQRCVDAYVSLHRAEGFGLGLAECMRIGKPVIATGWSGNMEFMTTENSCLVDYRLVPVGAGEYLHHAGQRWAEPDVGQAALHMRRLVDDPNYGKQVGARAAATIQARLSCEAVAARLIHRLDAISRMWDARTSDATPSKAD